MKKAFIIIALIIVFCSISVSAAPFNLVVGKEGSKAFDGSHAGVQFYFPFEFSRPVFIGEINMEAWKTYNRCGGYWFAELLEMGETVKTSGNKGICKVHDGHGCWSTADLSFEKADTVVIRSADLRSTCSRGSCHPGIRGTISFVEGKSIPSAISSRSEIVGFGSVKSVIDGFSFIETSGDSFVVKSSNPRVLVWVGGRFDNDALETSTDNWFDDIWACYDGDLNNKCDFAEDDDCSAYGGDFYKGVCCGRDVKCGYVDFWEDKEINAWCGLLDNGNWAWLAKENVGEIFNFDCPGSSMVSDGDSFISCSEILNGGFSGFFTLSTGYGSREYVCLGDDMFECSAGRPFSSHNSAGLGETSLGLSDLVCPAGMISYWPLDNNADNFIRDFAHGVSNAVSFADGNIGQAARFSSPESDIEISHSVLNVSWPAFSVEAWIKPSDGSGVVFNKESSYELYLDNGLLKASVYTGEGSVFLESDNPLTLDIWSHVVLSYDGSSAAIFVNSRAVDSDALSGNVQISVKPFIIGARAYSPNDPFSGLIDEVAFYSVALPEEVISSHYNTPVSYCGVSNFSEVFYCASDGDWTTDLDSKDSKSCRAAGFEWTGHQCCGEFDDPHDSYSDFSSPAVPVSSLVLDKNDADQVSEYEFLLTNENAFVAVKGRSRIIVTRTFWRSERGGMVLCSEKDEEVSSFDLGRGQSKKVVNYFHPEEPDCTYGRTSVLSAPILAVGGCFDSEFYPSGSFLQTRNVVNYNGGFLACLQIPPALEAYDFVDINEDFCGDSLINITPGLHGVCLPDGVWSFISIPGVTVVDETLWNPADYGLDAYKQGCCPEGFCWNGTGCQPAGTFYRVNSDGFVCR